MASFFVLALLFATANLLAQPFNIFQVNVRTGDAEQVSFLDNQNFNPSYSNNGHAIVHESFPVADVYDVLMRTDVATGVSTPIPGTQAGNDASWSPDGNQIAFDLYGYNIPAIFTIPATGGTPEFVFYPGVDPEWSQNSQMLAFLDWTTGMISTIDLATGEVNPVAYGGQPCWSPNGQYIAYIVPGDRVSNIFQIEVDPAGEPVGTPIQLTFDADFSDIYNGYPTYS
ncbi:MAG: PD40 domain-containing protein, partial [Lewinella sp.]|nr:PD40 domain-containing protein [Lewinella sp.]